MKLLKDIQLFSDTSGVAAQSFLTPQFVALLNELTNVFMKKLFGKCDQKLKGIPVFSTTENNVGLKDHMNMV